jgi:transcription initiation factor TFIIIB Brf1 subunit/transcription initiation factor TFIIB
MEAADNNTLEEKNSRSRTGAPTSLAIHDRGLATIISKTGKDLVDRSWTPEPICIERLRKED